MSDIFAEMENFEPVEVSEHPTELGMIEESIEAPHWKLDRNAFADAIAPFKEIGGVANNNVVTRSIFMECKDGMLYLRGNNKDVFLEKSVKVENVEKVLDQKVAVSVQDLDLLVRRCYSKVIFYIPEPGFAAIRLYKSNFYLDVVNVGDYLFNFVERPKQYTQLAINEFQILVSTMHNAMKLAVRPEDRKVIVYDNYAYGSFLVSAVRVFFKGLPNTIIRAGDLAFLKLLVPNQQTVYFAEYGDRVFFKGDDYEFSTLKSDVSLSEVQKSLTGAFEQPVKSAVSADLSEFKEVIYLLSKLSNTTGMVEFFSENNEFFISYMTKTNKKSKFKIGDGQFPDKVTLSVEGLRKTLSLLSESPIVTINSVESGVLIDTKDIRVLLATK